MLRRRDRPSGQGPYLNAALLCLGVHHDMAGNIRIDRILDRVTRDATSPPTLACSLLVILRGGRARGPHRLAIRITLPDEKHGATAQDEITFAGDDERVAREVPIDLRCEQDGVYWFDVLLDGALLTRVPLRVVGVDGQGERGHAVE